LISNGIPLNNHMSVKHMQANRSAQTALHKGFVHTVMINDYPEINGTMAV
jgi:hypothetical protein